MEQIVIPQPVKHGSFGYIPGRVALMDRLLDSGVPIALMDRIRWLPQEQWEAAAQQEGFVAHSRSDA